MKPVRDFMTQFVRDYSAQPLVVEVVLKGQWKSLLGERISENSMPVSFQEGVLKIAASDERWLAELSRMSGEIRTRLNQAFGREVVKSLVFVAKS
jgi:predicted nucleic acid-binding Zn ribbon protein